MTTTSGLRSARLDAGLPCRWPLRPTTCMSGWLSINVRNPSRTILWSIGQKERAAFSWSLNFLPDFPTVPVSGERARTPWSPRPAWTRSPASRPPVSHVPACPTSPTSPASRTPGLTGIETAAVVFHNEQDMVGPALQQDADPLGVGVPGHVGERFLGDAIKCRFHLKRQPVRFHAVTVKVHRQTGCSPTIRRHNATGPLPAPGHPARPGANPQARR